MCVDKGERQVWTVSWRWMQRIGSGGWEIGDLQVEPVRERHVWCCKLGLEGEGTGTACQPCGDGVLRTCNVGQDAVCLGAFASAIATGSNGHLDAATYRIYSVSINGER